MTYSQQQFLNQFDQPIRNYIIEYCKKISEKNYDVYLLMALKKMRLLLKQIHLMYLLILLMKNMEMK